MPRLRRALAFSAFLVCLPGLSRNAYAQTDNELTARTLYYNSGSDAKPDAKTARKTSGHPAPAPNPTPSASAGAPSGDS